MVIFHSYVKLPEGMKPERSKVMSSMVGPFWDHVGEKMLNMASTSSSIIMGGLALRRVTREVPVLVAVKPICKAAGTCTNIEAAGFSLMSQRPGYNTL